MVFACVFAGGLAYGPAGAAPLRPEPKPGLGTLRPPDPYFPNLGNSGYDVEHYDLHIAIAHPEGGMVSDISAS